MRHHEFFISQFYKNLIPSIIKTEVYNSRSKSDDLKDHTTYNLLTTETEKPHKIQTWKKNRTFVTKYAKSYTPTQQIFPRKGLG